MSGSRTLLVALAMLALSVTMSCAMTWDVQSDFTTASNPNGAWSYGWQPSFGTAMNLYNYGILLIAPQHPNEWLTDSLNVVYPYGAIIHNPTANLDSDLEDYIFAEPHQVQLWTCFSGRDPQAISNMTMIRWTSTIQGTVDINAVFSSQRGHIGDWNAPAYVYIQKNSSQGATNVYTGALDGFAGTSINGYADSFGTAPVLSYSGGISVNPGDTIDFLARNTVYATNRSQSVGLAAVLSASISPGTVSGTVRSTATGTPVIPGATVAAVGGDSTTTGSDGNFSLTLPPGEYTITASKIGYSTSSWTVTLASGDNKTHSFSLSSGAVSGRVTANIPGNPSVPGAKVVVTDAVSTYTTTSDSAGNFSVTVGPGPVTVKAAKYGFMTASRSVTVVADSTVSGSVVLPVGYDLAADWTPAGTSIVNCQNDGLGPWRYGYIDQNNNFTLYNTYEMALSF